VVAAVSGVYPPGADLITDATVSADGRYRYRLRRCWGPGTLLPFVMLNPSTADARADDPTIRRCVGFARAHGFDGVTVVNLFAYRATKPADLWAAAADGVDIVGSGNDDLLLDVFDHAARRGTPVVAAWGAGAPAARAADVAAYAATWSADVLHHLGLTATGAPRHPLYVKADTPLTPWRP
jgi:hypothetical protein